MYKPKQTVKVATPWGVEGGSSVLNAPHVDYPKNMKAPWINGSSLVREEDAKRATMDPCEVKAPWEPEPEDAEEEFDRRVAAEAIPPPQAPWNKDQIVLPNNGDKKANYNYQSLHAPVPLTKERLEMNAKYKYNPPFTTEDNVQLRRKEDEKRKEKTVKTTPPTIAPWDYGSLESTAAPEGKRVNAHPKDTSLWSIPDSEKPKKKDALESSGDPILDKLRLKLRDMGSDGIFGLARKFKIMDDDGSGTLSQSEFNKAMAECRMELTAMQLKHLFRYFDRGDDGSISYDEFLVGIRGVLNRRRRRLVNLAFNVLDRDQSGVIDMDDIEAVYDVSRHPDVIARRRTKRDVLNEFISQMEVGADKDGKVTIDEFENYYANISASIDDDDYFELMIRNAWHISGGEGQCANTSNRRVLVTHADGRQTVEEIKDDIGMHGDDKKSMMRNLNNQGITATKLESAYGNAPGKNTEIREDSVDSYHSRHSNGSRHSIPSNSNGNTTNNKDRGYGALPPVQMSVQQNIPSSRQGMRKPSK